MKSPIKGKLLRNPGESLDRKLLDVFLDEMVLYFIAAILMVYLAVMEWWRWYSGSPPSPVAMTLAAAVTVLIAAWKIRQGLKKVARIKLGLSGEKAVGQFLERLRMLGARVFHDVPADGFNLDHVVIHGSGIYVIETKTLSKPEKGDARLVFDGQRVLKNGHEMDRNAVVQVTAASHWLHKTLKSSTGRSVPIRPVVVFPGWFIQPTFEARKSNVWVLNPKALPAFIGNSAPSLTSEEVHLCSYHLTKYIQASQS